MYRIGVKPGKAVSVVGTVIGILFFVLGLTVIVPTFGVFGLVWTVAAGAIAAFYAYNLFSQTGASDYQVDVDASGNGADLDTRLRELTRLRQEGLVSDDEYQQKRAEILRQL
jgi:hypothetical protein